IPEATDAEGARVVQRFDAAVGALIDQGIVDPERVGISGFSRAGYQALYLLTHPGAARLAAAILSHAWTEDFTSYVGAEAVDSGPGDNYEAVHGGTPFWRNPRVWLDEDPFFNIHRVQAPVLMTQHGYGSTDSMIESRAAEIGAFRLNRRPLEYLY